MKTRKISWNLNLERSNAVAFDFDGVIHKYSKGWLDGEIYDKPNQNALDLILLLQSIGIPCVIISTRSPEQIEKWWRTLNTTIKVKVLDYSTIFFNDCSYVGITNRKIPAQVYIDDRAYKYTNQTTVKDFLMDFSELEKPEEIEVEDSFSQYGCYISSRGK